ncbi:MAG: acylphosphatase [Pseudomonadales bacterium]|jgi:acylphosphatase
MGDQRTVQGRVTGRVQGVAFRASFRRQALSLSLHGWVRNLPDGAVGFLVQGDSDDVARMIDWAGRGPRLARVDEVAVRDVERDPALDGFEIRY